MDNEVSQLDPDCLDSLTAPNVDVPLGGIVRMYNESSTAQRTHVLLHDKGEQYSIFYPNYDEVQSTLDKTHPSDYEVQHVLYVVESQRTVKERFQCRSGYLVT